jgi:hypothetical protein
MCGKEVAGGERPHLIVDALEHRQDETTGRAIPIGVTRRHWVFCTRECRDTWYEEPTEEAFTDESGLPHNSRLVRLVAVQIEPGCEPRLHDDQRFERGASELHRYWRTGQRSAEELSDLGEEAVGLLPSVDPVLG